jgi:hypothetical protein
MGRVLAHYLHEWHKKKPYAKPTDFVSPSMNRSGGVPICSSVFCADYLRPAAKAAGVPIPDGHRWSPVISLSVLWTAALASHLSYFHLAFEIEDTGPFQFNTIVGQVANDLSATP